jgi:hypothetical protein
VHKVARSVQFLRFEATPNILSLIMVLCLEIGP